MAGREAMAGEGRRVRASKRTKGCIGGGVGGRTSGACHPTLPGAFAPVDDVSCMATHIETGLFTSHRTYLCKRVGTTPARSRYDRHPRGLQAMAGWLSVPHNCPRLFAMFVCTCGCLLWLGWRAPREEPCPNDECPNANSLPCTPHTAHI